MILGIYRFTISEKESTKTIKHPSEYTLLRNVALLKCSQCISILNINKIEKI